MTDRSPHDPATHPSRRAARAATDGPPAARSGAHAGSDGASGAHRPRSGSRPASGTLDALFTGEVDTDDVGRAPGRNDRDRKKSRIAKWIVLVVVLAMVGGIGAGALWVWNTYENQIRSVLGWEESRDFEPGEATGEALVTVVDGDDWSSISQKLFDADVLKTPNALYNYLVSSGQNPEAHAGVYALQQRMTSEAALGALQDPANRRENVVQLPEGLTVDRTLDELAASTGLPREEFEAATSDPSVYGIPSDSFEGWLFPSTYRFDPGAVPADIIGQMVGLTVDALDDAGVPVDEREETLTVASIIQREARFEDDFYQVSRVIQNRLDPANDETHGLLQMDSTVQYGYGQLNAGVVSTSTEARNDDNGWNTYIHPGLPVGPIANPGELAIKAAIDPADGPWLYFVTVNLDTGETIFTNTYAEHQVYVQQWQTWCADNPDSGC